MSEPEPRDLRREHFDELAPVTTRWSDNDMFGHLNNSVYFELFDTVLNAWMMRGTGIDESVAPVLVHADGSTDPETSHLDGGFLVLDVPTREDAVRWAARIAAGCRTPQELRVFGDDPES